MAPPSTSISIYLDWLTMSQYSYRTLSTRVLKHAHFLSMDFHLNQKPGVVAGALDKAAVISQLLDLIIFTITPVIFDLGLVFDSLTNLMIGLWILLYSIR